MYDIVICHDNGDFHTLILLSLYVLVNCSFPFNCTDQITIVIRVTIPMRPKAIFTSSYKDQVSATYWYYDWLLHRCNECIWWTVFVYNCTTRKDV